MTARIRGHSDREQTIQARTSVGLTRINDDQPREPESSERSATRPVASHLQAATRGPWARGIAGLASACEPPRVNAVEVRPHREPPLRHELIGALTGSEFWRMSQTTEAPFGS